MSGNYSVEVVVLLLDMSGAHDRKYAITDQTQLFKMFDEISRRFVGKICPTGIHLSNELYGSSLDRGVKGIYVLEETRLPQATISVNYTLLHQYVTVYPIKFERG